MINFELRSRPASLLSDSDMSDDAFGTAVQPCASSSG